MLSAYHYALRFTSAILFGAYIASTATGATLRSWHKLDETSGPLAADSSGNANGGTYTGAPALAAEAPHRFGAYFAADGQFVTAPASTTLNAIGATNGDFSVAFWIKPNGFTGGWRPMLHKGSVDSERGPGLWLQPGNNRIHFRISTTAAWNEGSDSVADLPNGVWSHVACVKEANKWRCYVNGVLDTEFTLSAGTVGNNGPLYVGDDPWYAGCKAWMDDVRLYEGALTAAEVKILYGQVGHWKLNETAGATAADSSGFAANGALSGAAAWTADCAGARAFNFDGTANNFAIANALQLQPTASLSVAAWIKGDTWGAGDSCDAILRKGDANPNNYQFAIADGRVSLYLDASDAAGIRGNTVLSAGTWYHVAGTWDGANVRIYVNGVLDNTPTARTGTIGVDTRPLYIGGRPGADQFDGMIRDVQLYNRALLASEVQKFAGVAGAWRFNEGVGVTAADTSGLDNNATLSGGAAWTTDCAGNNNALLTNGAGGIASTATAVTPPAVGTVAFWMRSSGSPAGTARVFGLGGDWEVRQSPDGKLSFDLCGDATPHVISTIPLNEVGRWYHVVATFDSGDDTYAIYIDGQLNKSGTNSVAMNQQPAGILSFGTRTGSTEYWQGALRDFRIYGRKLCSTEIAQLYGLSGHWRLDESSGIIVSDSSGLNNQGLLTGTTIWTTGVVNGAHRFNYIDGDDYVAISNSATLENVQEGNYTVAAWFKPLSVPPGSGSANDAAYGILLKNGYHLGLRYTASRAFHFDHWLTGDVAASTFTSSPSFGPGAFYHVAGTLNRTTGTASLYVNGILRHTASFTAGTATREYGTVPWRIGIANPAAGSWKWAADGVVDDARIYTRVLCAEEVLRLYSAGSPQGVKIIKWVEIQ